MSTPERLRAIARGGVWVVCGVALLAFVAVALSPRPTTAGSEVLPVRPGPVGATAIGEFENCGGVEIRGRKVRGGCEFHADGARVRLAVLSMFGDQQLGSCPIYFGVHLATDGEIVFRDIVIQDDEGGPACGDLLVCSRQPRANESVPTMLPWKGRVVTGTAGRHTAVVDTCFDTCFGRFEGKARFRLEPVARKGRARWELAAARAPVGRSGLEIAGVWPLAPGP